MSGFSSWLRIFSSGFTISILLSLVAADNLIETLNTFFLRYILAMFVLIQTRLQLTTSHTHLQVIIASTSYSSFSHLISSSVLYFSENRHSPFKFPIPSHLPYVITIWRQILLLKNWKSLFSIKEQSFFSSSRYCSFGSCHLYIFLENYAKLNLRFCLLLLIAGNPRSVTRLQSFCICRILVHSLVYVHLIGRQFWSYNSKYTLLHYLPDTKHITGL